MLLMILPCLNKDFTLHTLHYITFNNSIILGQKWQIRVKLRSWVHITFETQIFSEFPIDAIEPYI